MRKLKPEAWRRGGATILSPKDSGGTPQVGSLVSCRRDRALAPTTSEGGEGGKAARAERGNSSVLQSYFYHRKNRIHGRLFRKGCTPAPLPAFSPATSGWAAEEQTKRRRQQRGKHTTRIILEASNMYVSCREAGPLAVATRTVASTTRNTDS